jgi:hypothetical protein
MSVRAANKLWPRPARRVNVAVRAPVGERGVQPIATMKPILAVNRILTLGCAVWLFGCATKPTSTPQPAATVPTAAAAAPPTAPAVKSAGEDLPAKISTLPLAPFEGEGWQSLFDGVSLGRWREIDFAGRGEVRVESGLVLLAMGSPFTGIRWTNEFPRVDYEIAFDALRTMGSDFFCGLTVPVRDSHCSLIVGGWGGGLVGISSIEGMDASENETTKYMSFDTGRWYRIRMRVTAERIEAWIDKEKVANTVTTGRRISMRPGDIELSAPLGISAWQTGAALREIKWRRVEAPDGPPPK